jgi:hypothetical protein
MNSAAYDHALVRQFMALFPTSPMTVLLGGYFSYIGVPMSDEEDKPLVVLEDDSFDTIIVSVILSNSHRYILRYFPECVLRHSQLLHFN